MSPVERTVQLQQITDGFCFTDFICKLGFTEYQDGTHPGVKSQYSNITEDHIKHSLSKYSKHRIIFFGSFPSYFIFHITTLLISFKNNDF